MLTDHESRVVGPLVVAFGAGFFAAGLARILWPAADGMIYLASLGIGFGFPLLAAGLWSIRADMRRLDVDVADSTSNRKLTDAKAELMLADAAVRLAATQAPVADEAEPELSTVYAQRWRIMCHRYLTYADRHGWAIRMMVGAGVVSWDGWTAISNVLTEAGVMVKSPRAGWAPGWDFGRWEAESRQMTLPHPQADPPTVEISPTGNATTPHNTPKIIDAEAQKG